MPTNFGDPKTLTVISKVDSEGSIDIQREGCAICLVAYTDRSGCDSGMVLIDPTTCAELAVVFAFFYKYKRLPNKQEVERSLQNAKF